MENRRVDENTEIVEEVLMRAMASLEASDSDIYLASIVESATEDCL